MNDSDTKLNRSLILHLFQQHFAVSRARGWLVFVLLVSEPEVLKFVEKDEVFLSHDCFTF